ncbi:AAEL005149-PA, partial [Aedes aegypti]
RQDTDERLRRLQTDKEALALQVKMLTEQVQTQGTKISDLERTVSEKNQLLSNADDLLQREMLSRSSLETQKLELMSAMSELKLQQAALERENLELRSSLINGTPLTNGSLNGGILNSNTLNNNSIAANLLRRTGRMVTSTPGNSINSGGSAGTDANANPKRNVAFGNSDSETLSSDRLDGQASQRSYTPQPSPSPSMSHKNLKGLRNIFGKIKRSNSGTLEDVDPGEFKRGGVRATAGARLGWSSEFRRPDKPLKEWDLDSLCQWFDHLGLGMYEEDLRRWLKTGGAAELIRASPIDIEKELNLKSPLHRKKIVLAIADLSESVEGDMLLKSAGKLDTPWIIRWLEDVGLPQYKDSFMAARMDGRMLHKLTMDDLVSLHVSSCVHVASLRRGIQLMREQKWNPDCLIRRSMSDENNGTKEDVRLWTCYRVMEWLRAVDLSEYSPNLRGAGVHGALMMYEVKFTAELLAELLSIPPSKTLLRRHLATHFKELLGRDVIQAKRDAENTLGFQPLTLAAKIKTPKKSQFSLKRKKSSKGGDEWSDYVCPMGDSGQEHLPNSQPPSSSHQSLSTASSSSSSVGAAAASTATGNVTTTSTTTTSATSNYQQQHHQHNSHNSHQASPYRANTNLVTSNASAAVSCQLIPVSNPAFDEC